ncbi:MAG: proton-conducting transporter membrane subunit [Thermodesulfobacteriota bacterium]
MTGLAIGSLILFPLLAAAAALPVCRTRFGRLALVLLTVAVPAAGSLLLRAPGEGDIAGVAAVLLCQFASWADFLLLAVLAFLGWRIRSWPVVALSLLQLVLLAQFETRLSAEEARVASLFVVDGLSLAMVRLVSLVGGLICLYALSYMRTHEEHRHVIRSRQPRFFSLVFLFLGAMNGLVLCNDLSLIYLFYELTTLCSFLLIVHDDTVESRENGRHALLVNSCGGLALLVGVRCLYAATGTLDLQQLVVVMADGQLLLPLALLCLAAMIKSAQLPFQKWLLGAMVAPTPVSALLHAATMVNGGAYLVLRFSPALAGSRVGTVIATLGGLCFMATAALALGERNAKRIFALSTAGNLGLIFAAAGLGTPRVAAVGLFLLLFHAIAKGLLFLCIGTAEQRLRSRDLETMRGLLAVLPATGAMAAVAALALILPPFGMLFGKWLLLEAGAANIVFYLLLVLGNGFTVLYWVRFVGTLASSPGPARGRERIGLAAHGPQAALCLAVLVASGAADQLYAWCRAAASVLWRSIPAELNADPRPLAAAGGEVILFPFLPLLLFALLLGLWATAGVGSAGRGGGGPYLAGGNSSGDGAAFIGPMERTVPLETANSYLTDLFGEHFSFWAAVAAWVLLLLLFGVMVWT